MKLSEDFHNTIGENAMDDLMKKLHESAEYISGRIGGRKVEIAMVLRSGLGELGEKIENSVFID